MVLASSCMSKDLLYVGEKYFTASVLRYLTITTGFIMHERGREEKSYGEFWAYYYQKVDKRVSLPQYEDAKKTTMGIYGRISYVVHALGTSYYYQWNSGVIY